VYEPLLSAGWDIRRFKRPIPSEGRTKAGKMQSKGALGDDHRIECVYRNSAVINRSSNYLFSGLDKVVEGLDNGNRSKA